MIDASRLRGLGADGIATLLRRRPEAVAPPVPESLTELAERLTSPGSVLAALRRLDRPTLQVAEALAALGGEARREAIDRVLGVPDVAEPAAVTRALTVLTEHAVLLDDPGTGRLRLVDAAAAAWPRPLGLGVPMRRAIEHYTSDDLRAVLSNVGVPAARRKAENFERLAAALSEPDLVRSLLDRAPPGVRDLLTAVARDGVDVAQTRYYSVRFATSRDPGEWAIAHGLLVDTGGWGSELVMPAEVALAIRGPGYPAPFDPVPPAVERVAVDPELVTRAGAAAGSAMVRLVAALLDEAGRSPLTTLRAGGVGARELRRLVKRLGCEEPQLRLALALAHQAGLLTIADGQAVPTDRYDQWLAGEPADRLAGLMRTWLALPYPALGGDPAWRPGTSVPGTTRLRAALLTAAPEPAAAPPEQAQAPRDPAALAAWTVWQRPYTFGDPDSAADRALACWQEADLLGVVAAGALTGAGHGLLTGAPDLADRLGGIGSTEHTVRLQADLTAIVAGTPAPALAALLDVAAEPESRGTAGTWRFTPASVRRALDGGYTAESLREELAAVAVGGLPQPLEYLIADLARRHGAVRASAVACCLRGDDPSLLDEIAADRRLRTLGLRRLAPTVLAAAVPLADVLAALRTAGYAPVAEAADGTPVLERATPHRAGATSGGDGPVRRPGAGGSAEPRPDLDLPDPDAVARALLAAPDTPAEPPSETLATILAVTEYLSPAEARILAHAIDTGRSVRISYLSRDGGPTTRVISEIELSAGSMSAWCHLRAANRWFNVGRVVAVEPTGLDRATAALTESSINSISADA